MSTKKKQEKENEFCLYALLRAVVIIMAGKKKKDMKNTDKVYVVLCFFLGGQIILFCDDAIAR